MATTAMAKPKRPRTRRRMDFGRRLRVLREEHVLSQEQLGERVGVSRAYVSQMEIGQGWPSTGLLSKLAEALDVTTDYLLRGDHA